MEIVKDPFSEDLKTKQQHMTAQMIELTEYHRTHCGNYARILAAKGYQPTQVDTLMDIPFLPVTLFKKLRLSSIAEEADDYKVITSSGTSGQQTSQIILDGETRQLQQQVLASIGSSFIGEDRLPMLVIDCPATVKKRDHYSARTAGILGFSLFGRGRTFALKDDMSLDMEAVTAFLDKYGQQPFLLYGFTFIVWQYFIRQLESGKHGRLDMTNGILIHGGGWKKLQAEAVSKRQFKQRIADCCGINRVMDYYGMAEQSGSIFMECECGHLHVSDYSAVITRRAKDFSPCKIGEKGLLQVMSVVPRSYPGHSLLTEDEGTILGVDDCPCGRKGVYFEVHGRVKAAELRGCSDTFAATQQQETTAFKWVLGDDEKLQNIGSQEPRQAFDLQTVDYLHDVSKRLLHDTAVKKTMPDVHAFAFWCRKGHLHELQERWRTEAETRMGRGVSLHFAASNIPTLFGYSIAAGLLSGNSCIVRMPRKITPQETAIVNAMRECMETDYPDMRGRILLCRYGHDDQLNQRLSRLCDARVIWGSDASVRVIQQATIKQSAVEISFGNRYSACVIHAESVLNTEALDVMVKGFYNDTYLNDQNACSAPRLICWYGSPRQCMEAKERFWHMLHQLLQNKGYSIQETCAVQKLDAEYMLAATMEEGIVSHRMEDNLIRRIQMARLNGQIWDNTVPGGLFLEYDTEDLNELDAMLIKSFQTLTVFDTNGEIISDLPDSAKQKIKRIVPVGHGLDFDLMWDGHDLIRELTVDNKPEKA